MIDLPDLLKQIEDSGYGEAEADLKQALALEPTYPNIVALGSLLNRIGRYEDAEAVLAYLWEHRTEGEPDEVLLALNEYLVTLSALKKGERMIAVAGEAMSEMEFNPDVAHGFIHGHILAERFHEARVLVDELLPLLPKGDPIHEYLVMLVPALDQAIQEAEGAVYSPEGEAIRKPEQYGPGEEAP